MIAIVFSDNTDCHVAVFDFDLLKKDEIRFVYNSWRGDVFAPELEKAIEKYREGWRNA